MQYTYGALYTNVNGVEGIWDGVGFYINDTGAATRIFQAQFECGGNIVISDLVAVCHPEAILAAARLAIAVGSFLPLGAWYVDEKRYITSSKYSATTLFLLGAISSSVVGVAIALSYFVTKQ